MISKLPFASFHLCAETPGLGLLGVMMNVRSAPRLRDTIILGLTVSANQNESEDQVRFTLFSFVSLCLPIYSFPLSYRLSMTWLNDSPSQSSTRVSIIRRSGG